MSSDSESDVAPPPARRRSSQEDEESEKSEEDSDAPVGKRKGNRKTASSKVIVETSSDDDSDDDDDGGRARGKKKPGRKAKSSPVKSGKRRSTVDEDSDSEDEIKKAAAAVEDLDGYGSDLYGDDEDRERLEAMTEMEREQELFRRLERREMLKTRQTIKQKLAAKNEGKDEKPSTSKKTAAKASKKKTVDSDGEDELFDNFLERPSERREKTAKKSAMSSLIKARKEKQKAAQKKLDLTDVFGKEGESDSSDDEAPNKPKRARNKSESSNSSKSSGSGNTSSLLGSDSDKDDDDEEKESPQIKSKDKLEKIRLSRFRLAKLIHAPFFAKTATGCFVRIGIGNNPKTGVAVYRVAEIVDVVPTGKTYDVEGTRTNKGLRLKFGTNERVYRLEFISNSNFSESEFSYWIQEMARKNLPLPTEDHCKRKQEEIGKAKTHTYTEKEIQQMVKEKQQFVRTPANYSKRKTFLMKEMELAQQAGDRELAAEYREKLEQLEHDANEVKKKAEKHISGISWINQRNRELMTREHLDTLFNTKSEVKEQVFDPYTRRQGESRVLASRGKKNKPVDVPVATSESSDAQQPTTSEPPNPAAPLPSYVPDLGAAIPKALVSAAAPPPLPKLPDLPKRDDLFSAHDFDVEIDLNVPSMSGVVATPVVRPIETSGGGGGVRRQALSLEEYKRKRGHI